MCGIAGKVCVTEPVDRALVERMCEVIAHRGPDSRGVFIDGRVGLGVQRLRVIDLETGDQPLFNEDRSIVVVLNGEIYNYRELRTELVAKGHTFRTQSDTEVIVHLYEELGARCVDRLRGMFAFAVWDARQRRLVLARDRLGKKPLFYSAKRGTLWFGSEIRAILEDPEIERTVDFAAIDSFLHYQYVPDPRSAFAELKKLPPAHTLIWRDGEIRIDRYWKLSYRPGPVRTEPEAHELIRDHLLEATRLRLRSDVPLGAFLSGGVDSSAVVAAMAKQASRIKTFSIGFDVADYDETPYAREIARLFDTEHEELRVTPSAMDVLPKLVAHFGEPFADSSAIPSFYLAELTRRHVTVALNGDGGDENFGGYTRYLPHRRERLLALPRPLQVALARVARSLGTGAAADSFGTRLNRAASWSLMPADDRYAHTMAYFDDRERQALYTDEFREVVRDASPAEDFIRTAFQGSDAADDVNRLLDTDIQTYLPGDLLVKMDIASMAHSLEVRSPLLDHRLMELTASLPGSWKVKDGATKKIFKDALRPWLPSHILDRPKAGFAVPLAHWFRTELRGLPEEIVLDPRALGRGFFREEELRRLIDAHASGKWDNSHKLWALVQLELWFTAFVDGERREPDSIGLVPSLP
jgi:asparagine synthase (glutamine-hydrolysing)